MSVTQANIKQNFQFAQLAYLTPQTGWENKGPITITSTGTAPTKGATTIDSVSCRRDGPDLKLRYVLNFGSGGVNGAGDYLFSIEDCAGTSNIEIDSDLINFYTDIIGGAGNYLVKSSIGTWEVSNGASVTAAGTAIAYDATRFRLAGRQFTDAPASITTGVVGASFLGFGSPRYLAITVSVPIKQWRLGTTAVDEQVDFDNLDNHAYYTAIVDGTVSPSIVSEENADWITGNCTRTATGRWSCTVPEAANVNPKLCIAGRINSPPDGNLVISVAASSIPTRIDIVSNTSNALNAAFALACFKDTADYQKAFRSTMLGLFKQSNIIQDVEQFPTTEQKLCDACYKGKALYKKCRTGSFTNDTVMVSSGNSTQMKSAYGSFVILGTEMNFPYAISSTHGTHAARLTSTGEILLRVDGWAITDSNICVEYLKD